MFRTAPFLVSAFLLASLACEETLSPVVGDVPAPASDSTTVALGGTVDIIDGIRYYKDVHVEGTLTYCTEFFDEPQGSETRSWGGRVGVSLHVALRFRRINDYQGVTQNWHAGGKSYDILDLQDDGSAMTHKVYQLWGVANSVFVNIEFLVQRSDVRVHNIWTSYAYPDSGPSRSIYNDH